MLEFRALTPDEIEVRVGTVGDGWASLLLYKDARVDMSILDETVGPGNWTRDHFECKGNLFCRVGINMNYEKCNKDDKYPEKWIYKSDCGAETYTEKEKGESSDSFKRACVNWNIGRELYTKIPIFVNVPTTSYTDKGKTLYKMGKKERFTVGSITIDKKANKIKTLTILDKNGDVAFNWSDEKKTTKTKAKSTVAPKPSPTKAKKAGIDPFTGKPISYDPYSEMLPDEQLEAIMKASAEDTPKTTTSGKTRVRRS